MLSLPLTSVSSAVEAHCNYVVTQKILGAAVDIVNQTNLLTEIQCFR